MVGWERIVNILFLVRRLVKEGASHVRTCVWPFFGMKLVVPVRDLGAFILRYIPSEQLGSISARSNGTALGIKTCKPAATKRGPVSPSTKGELKSTINERAKFADCCKEEANFEQQRYGKYGSGRKLFS